MPYDTLPSNATLKPEEFTAHVSDSEIDDFKQLLKLSRIGPKTYENQNPDDYLGISREWLVEAKDHWLNNYHWRKTEDRINSFNNYTVQIEDIKVHFVGLFSKKSNAVPIAFFHGWPGSILEFLPVLDLLRKKYNETDLPYHVIVPSVPGYGYSSGPPLDRRYRTEDAVRVLDQLMTGLGLSGYLTQGGDIGSFISRVLGAKYDSCKAVHLNFCQGIPKPENTSIDGLSDIHKHGLDRDDWFETYGNAYSKEHGTRPATIGLVLSSSPIALLGWIAEKFQTWTDTTPSLDDILDSVTLYWYTDSFPRCIYPYRQFFGKRPTFFHNDASLRIMKPTGYSFFPEELAGMPPSWVAETVNLVWTRTHTEGGHFAAMEKPELFLQDIEEFVKQVWNL